MNMKLSSHGFPVSPTEYNMRENNKANSKLIIHHNEKTKEYISDVASKITELQNISKLALRKS